MAEEAVRNGLDVLVHLPMESSGKWLSREEEALLLKPGCTAVDVEKIVDQSLLAIPGAIGFSNHMGVLATEDETLMRTLMLALRARGMIFLDSLTTPRSKAWDVAGEERVSRLRRDIFLDHDKEVGSIEKAFESVRSRVAKGKPTVAIGHPHAETLELLPPGINRVCESGGRFVSIRAFAHEVGER